MLHNVSHAVALLCWDSLIYKAFYLSKPASMEENFSSVVTQSSCNVNLTSICQCL